MTEKNEYRQTTFDSMPSASPRDSGYKADTDNSDNEETTVAQDSSENNNVIKIDNPCDGKEYLLKVDLSYKKNAFFRCDVLL